MKIDRRTFSKLVASGGAAALVGANPATAAAGSPRSVPSRYVITTEDRTTAPELQRFVAARMNAKIVEIDSGDLSFVAHPRAITEVILGAVRGS